MALAGSPGVVPPAGGYRQAGSGSRGAGGRESQIGELGALIGAAGALTRPPSPFPSPGSRRPAKWWRMRSVPQLETVATVLLAAATVLTAWSAFQSAKWSGIQAIRFSQASASRTESVRASSAAGQQSLADISMFTAWLTATDQGQVRLAALLADRFRGEFAVAFRAWDRLSPLTDPRAPATPFAMPQYQLAEARRATELENLAITRFDQATAANQQADDYVMMTVVFAMALFFGAVSTRFSAGRLRAALLVCGLVTFLAAAAVTVTFPVRL